MQRLRSTFIFKEIRPDITSKILLYLQLHLYNSLVYNTTSTIIMPCTCTYPNRIRHVIAEGMGDAVVDVDGSYLYKKYKQMVDAGSSVSPLGPPQ